MGTKHCAVCGSEIDAVEAKRLPAALPGGLDGRPSFDVPLAAGQSRLAVDAALLAGHLAFETCTGCGHFAPDIAFAYPALKDAAESRAAVLALPKHAPLTRRYLVVANLFGEADPRAQGVWVLRAAWADEALGFVDSGRGLRRRAGGALEDALFQGFALEPVRGRSSLILGEIYRVAGDFDHAAQHASRGLAAFAPSEERFLHLLAASIRKTDQQPLTREILPGAEKVELPPAPPVRLRKARSLAPLKSEDAIVFAEDFLSPELLIDLLRDGRAGVLEGLKRHPLVFPVLLRATAQDEPAVRDAASTLLADHTPFSRAPDGTWNHDPIATAQSFESLDALGGANRVAARRIGQLFCESTANAAAFAEVLRGALPFAAMSDSAARVHELLDIASPRATPPSTPSFTTMLRKLLGSPPNTPRTAAQLRELLGGDARAVTTAGRNLKFPSWASGANGADDMYLEIGGDVLGVQLHDDSRGWGGRAELRVARGTRKELEDIVGPMIQLPRQLHRPRQLSVGIDKLQVLAEHDGDKILAVSILYAAPPNAPEPPSPAGVLFRIAYLPARVVIGPVRHDLTSLLAGATDPAVKHAYDFASLGLKITDRTCAEVLTELTALATGVGLTFPPPPTDYRDVAGWLHVLAAMSRPLRVDDPALDAAWHAGVAARKIWLAAESLSQLNDLRSAAPEHAGIRARTLSVLDGLRVGLAAFTPWLARSARPTLVPMGDGLKTLLDGIDLTPTDANGSKILLELPRTLVGRFDLIAQRYDQALPSKPTPTEADVYAKILAAPFDASYLIEFSRLPTQQDGPRSKMIEMQFRQWASKSLEAEAPYLAEARALVHAHPEWAAPLRELGAREIEYSGGFPRGITVDAETWLARSREFVACAPITSLRLRNARGRIKAISECIHLSQIEVLDLDGQDVTSEDLICLAQTDYGQSLSRLSVRDNPFSIEGVIGLSASLPLTELEIVDFGDNPASPIDAQGPDKIGLALEAKYGARRWYHPERASWRPTPVSAE